MKKLIKLSSYVLALFALSFMTSCGDDGGVDGEGNPEPLTYSLTSITEGKREVLLSPGDLKLELTFTAPDYSTGTVKASVVGDASKDGLEQVEDILGDSFTDISGSFSSTSFGGITNTVTEITVTKSSVSFKVQAPEGVDKGDAPYKFLFGVVQ